MSKFDKLIEKVMTGRGDTNISFADLCGLLIKLGFVERGGSGSHRTFARGELFVNLQPDGSKAKAYQVRQVREHLRKLGH